MYRFTGALPPRKVLLLLSYVLFFYKRTIFSQCSIHLFFHKIFTLSPMLTESIDPRTRDTKSDETQLLPSRNCNNGGTAVWAHFRRDLSTGTSTPRVSAASQSCASSQPLWGMRWCLFRTKSRLFTAMGGNPSSPPLSCVAADCLQHPLGPRRAVPPGRGGKGTNTAGCSRGGTVATAPVCVPGAPRLPLASPNVSSELASFWGR